MIELTKSGHSAVVVDMLSNSSKEALRRTEEIAGATFPLYAEAYNLSTGAGTSVLELVRAFEDSCRDTWNWQSQNPNGYDA